MPKIEETWMDGITTEMMEHICDNLCKYPDQLNRIELDDKCAECKMGRFVCDILNQYNKVNDFADSQCAKLMCEIHELKERDTAKKPKKYGATDSQGAFHPLVGVDGVPYDLCPNCDSNLCTTGMFGRSKERMKYCEKCGQKLDWSE